ncbi:MAG: hypothetical protein ABI758_00610 [Candidatus Woesebacteria bacterium]
MVKKLHDQYVRLQSVVLYIFFFVPLLLVLSFSWSNWANGILYKCIDPLPFVGFIAPFVHSVNGVRVIGDEYLYTPLVVYGIWFVFVLIIFVVPAILSSHLSKRIPSK